MHERRRWVDGGTPDAARMDADKEAVLEEFWWDDPPSYRTVEEEATRTVAVNETARGYV